MSRVLISPPFFFFIGSFIYMVIPWAMYHLNYLNVDFLIRATENHIQNGYHYNSMLFDFFVMNMSFFSGYIIATRFNFKRSRSIINLDNFPLSKKFIFLSLLSITTIAITKIYLAGIVPFLGYQFKPELLGPIATVCFTTMWFFHYTEDKKFIYLFLIASFWLIGLGSRMFVFLPVLSMLIYTIYIYPKKTIKIIIKTSIIVMFFVVVGVVRQGWKINIESFLGVIFAEPIFTSLGALYYIDTGRDIVNIPLDFIAASLNFIPSFLFPNKVEVMSLFTYSDRIHNPIGAQALIVSLYHNFGMFYPFFLSGIGFYFGMLLKNIHVRFYKAVYFSSLPFLIIHFQREGFVTFFKVIVFNALIFPLIVIFILRFILIEKK
ncbi:TPA: hypothetical protein ACSPZY_004203 [Aeromonas veronii]|uniref:hypothetical protein n=1 Tax=Aeromonas veronii TaxID=654 RepID=UPI00300661B0